MRMAKWLTTAVCAMALSWSGLAVAFAVPDDGAAAVEAEGAPSAAVSGEGAAAEGEAAEGAGAESADVSATPEGGEGADGEADGDAADGTADDEAAEPEPEIDPKNRVNPQQMPDSSFLYDTSIAELANADPYMNNQTVQVVGEAIGDILAAVDGPSYAWVMLQEKVDNDYPQISVLMTRTQSDLIDNLGRYGVQGTKLQVRGQFHLSCPQHDGLTDLHAESVTVVARGSVAPDHLEWKQFLPGVVLFVVAGALLLVFRRLQEGQR
ncbi:hypothetical protein [Parvibacter caecicola]|uniref:hypothetical protein n=1 Tax=Parvibacter caecicola TaxID=747645 RepID=UPI00137522DE|nr:hypothetical protein [Parvibacter caecicola]MCR2040952.1 hypothetical protein [Parvibacter caecicola]